ncbi:MAG: hypothetical protein C4548_09820 [Desulfobacteraceae bacterium]|jgi:SAM-dependent methyltransferase|nr:MAG: hypothetical protein C4548_09820 [Desulfobacteraceae bacterium]
MLKKLLRDYRQLLEPISNPDDFLDTYEEFIKNLALFENHALETVGEKSFAHYSLFFTNCQRRYLMLKEQKASRTLIKQNKENTLIQRRWNSEFENNSYNRVKDLSRMVDFSSCKKIVMVGCGAFPATLFWIYDHYPGMKYIGIDLDSDCIALSSSVSKELNLEKIVFEAKDGREYNYRDVDFVYIANQVTPKKDVLSRILETSSKKIQIVVRNPTPLGRLLAECVLKSSPSNFSFVQAGHPSKSFLSQDLLAKIN